MAFFDRCKQAVCRHEKRLILALLSAGLILLCGFCLVLYLSFCMPWPFSAPEGAGTGEGVSFAVEEAALGSSGFELGLSVVGPYYPVLEQAGYDEHYLVLRGYAFTPGESVTIPTSRFLLRDTETGRFYALPTTHETREDVTQRFGEGQAGLDASGLLGVANRELLVENRPYDVYIYYTTNGHNELIDTGERLTLQKGGVLLNG